MMECESAWSFASRTLRSKPNRGMWNVRSRSESGSAVEVFDGYRIGLSEPPKR